ncbi:MAG: SUMF1/EgtB/PvdO family nonheme iron enzyme [Victivallales bacterium]|nr:SUMF1/EgtB/PvdO family nonheme iron enzyme [Victivallales bacterium]
MNRMAFIPVLIGLWLLPLTVGAEEQPLEPPREKEIVAVHDFSVAEGLTRLHITGWWIAERMENELTQSGRYLIVTRAKIAKVLKEQNITSGPQLKPQELGKIVGAGYIITGQADYAAGKINLVVSMIDTGRKAGEIRRSFDLTRSCAAAEVAAQLPEMIEILARKLSMTPGEFLDVGLRAMQAGDFEAAVTAFTELGREAELKQIAAMTETVKEKHLEQQAAQLAIPGNTPGEMLDYGLQLMRRGDLNRAALVFYRLQHSKLARRIGSLMQVAKDGARKKEETIGKLLAEARKKFSAAISSRDEKERQRDPATLCDEAVTQLQTFLSNPGMQLSATERGEIETLTTEIETFRKKLFAGPSTERAWVIPGIKIELVPIGPGRFTAHSGTPQEDALEHPGAASITRPFWIGKYEITAGQFQYYLKNQGQLSRRERYEIDKEIDFAAKDCPLTASYRLKRGFAATMPMTSVSWRTARNFCAWLTQEERRAERLPAGYEYRLPTEAEWEYACRAGNTTAYSFGDTTAGLDHRAWYRANTSGQPHPVGGKQANAWGTYDMHGNVWEWCNDWYGDKFLVADVADPVGPDSSAENLKVARGGSYTSDPIDLQCSSRYGFDYKSGRKNIGFRIVCAPEL